MRVWIPVTAQQISEFKASKVLTANHGYSVTDGWAQSWDETDPEVLEAEILQVAGADSRLVVVAECLAEVQNSESGQIAISNPIANAQIQAIFAAKAAEPEDFLWFGPTEPDEALVWHSS
jgi:DNA polymerase III psi subunit